MDNFFFYKFPLNKFVYKSHLAKMFPCPSSTLEVPFPGLARHALSSIKPAIESSQNHCVALAPGGRPRSYLLFPCISLFV